MGDMVGQMRELQKELADLKREKVGGSNGSWGGHRCWNTEKDWSQGGWGRDSEWKQGNSSSWSGWNQGRSTGKNW